MLRSPTSWLLECLVPDRIDEYEQLEPIGEGGMGKVMLARHIPTGRKVALKILQTGVLDDDDLRRRFQRECRIAAQIRHPHIVEVYDFETGAETGPGSGNTPFIAMAYIDGHDLAEILQHGPLRPERAADIVGQVALALDCAHRAHLRHRDVKPKNIMIERLASDREHAWLLDWGIARPVDVHGVEPVTRVGVVVGTPAYIAPERLLGEVTADERADVYSLAVVLYECLSGRPPFGVHLATVLVAHLRREPDPLPPSVPAALREVVAKGLEKDPADRYRSAAEFRDALVEAVREPRDTGVDRQARQRVIAVVVPGLVGLVVALALAVTDVVDLAERWWIVPALILAGIALGYAARGAGGPPAAVGSAETRPGPPGGFPGRRG